MASKGKISKWDVIVIGAGPAGLAAASSARDCKAEVCIIEREERPGGILKQCIHDGFGLIRYREQMTGPEYAVKSASEVEARGIRVFLNTFLTELKSCNDGYLLTLVNSETGITKFFTRSIILAMGCRERTSRQVFIHGTRPSGIYTAGLAQYFINIQGYMPTKKCVILGSGDIGLIMARRLTFEGAEVIGVFEAKSEPSGLTRNIVQCLDDFSIPLHLNTTVKEVHGKQRVKAVTICNVDAAFNLIPGTEKRIECDSLILSVGLIPENDILEPLNIPLFKGTKGPVVDQKLMTMKEGLFSCGNALHVNDLADYVSESGDTAGNSAAMYALGLYRGRNLIPLKQLGKLLYAVPQMLDLNQKGKTILYFRSSITLKKAELKITVDGNELFLKKYSILRPPEMERIILDLADIPQNANEIAIELSGVDL